MNNLNAAIASHVFNFNVIWVEDRPMILDTRFVYDVPPYEKDWKMCMTVIDALHNRGFTFGLFRETDVYYGGFGMNGIGMKYGTDKDPIKAILRGALMAVGQGKE